MSNVLVVVAHPDDEVLMCGGTIAKHVADGDTVQVLFFTEGVTGRHSPPLLPEKQTEEIEKRIAMADAASKILGYEGETLGYRDQQLDTYPQLLLNREIELVVKKFQPDIVYTHWDQDNNLDHRLVSQACQVACRSVGRLFMGIPSGQWVNPMSTRHRRFQATHMCYVHDIIEIKQAALNCYRDELGETTADSTEAFEMVEFFAGPTWFYPHDKKWILGKP